MAHFPNFWGKKNLPKNPALSCTTSHGILAPCQNLEKINHTIPRNCLDRRKDGLKDRQTLFHRTLPALPGAQKEGLLKRLKNIEGKNEGQFKAIEDQGKKQLDAIKNIETDSKSLKTINFFNASSPEAKKIVRHAKEGK